MAISDRKEREKKELSELILRTAASQFAEHGFAKTSMRSIAKEIEYSPTTIYLYFKDKSELLNALSEKAFGAFYQQLGRCLIIKDPMERLKAMGDYYIEFALENPEYYDLMFIIRSPMESEKHKEGWQFGMQSHTMLSNVVQSCVDAGHFHNKSTEVIAFMILSFVHGMVSMHIRDRMKMYPKEKRKQMLHDSIDTFNEFLKGNA